MLPPAPVTVLIADDDPDAREVLGEMLERRCRAFAPSSPPTGSMRSMSRSMFARGP